jgi:hypothetical protein
MTTLLVLLLLAVIPIQAATVRVCLSGPPTCDSSDLQAVINAAVGGDKIILQAGEEFGTSKGAAWTIPQHTGSGYVTIQSSAVDLLPSGSRSIPAGYRVSPSDAPNMAKICNIDTTPTSLAQTENVIQFVAKTAYWKFIGLEIANCTTGVWSQANLISMLPLSGTLLIDDTPHHIVIDRCWIHGYAFDQGPNRGINIAANDVVITNSYIDEIHFTRGNQESHAIAIGNAGRNVEIRNNRITSSTEASFTGGGRDRISGRSPEGVVYKGNHVFRPGSYATYSYDQDPESATIPSVAAAITGQTWSDTDDMSQHYIRTESSTWRQLNMPLGASEPRCFPGALWRNRVNATIWKCNAGGTRWIVGAADIMAPWNAKLIASVVTGNPTTITLNSGMDNWDWFTNGTGGQSAALFSGGTGSWAALNSNKYVYTKVSGTTLTIPVNSTGFTGTGYLTTTVTPQFLGWSQKNGAEFKSGIAGMHYEGNIVQNTFPMTFGSQRGFCYLFNWIPSQDGPNTALKAIYWGNNICKDTVTAIAQGSIQAESQGPLIPLTVTPGTTTIISGLGSFFGRIGEIYYASEGTGDFADLAGPTPMALIDAGSTQGGTLPSGQGRFQYNSAGKSTAGLVLRLTDDSQNKATAWPGNITIDNNIFEIGTASALLGAGGYPVRIQDTGTIGWSQYAGTALQQQFSGTYKHNSFINRQNGTTYQNTNFSEAAVLNIHGRFGTADSIPRANMTIMDNLDESASRFVGSNSGGGGTCIPSTNEWLATPNGNVRYYGNVSHYSGVYNSTPNAILSTSYGGDPCGTGFSRVWGRTAPTFATTEANGSVPVVAAVATFVWAAAARLLPGSRFCVTASTPSDLIGCYVVPAGVTESSTTWNVSVPGVPNNTYTGVTVSSSMDFVDYANRDYRLASSSVFKGTGTVGADPGVDQNVVEWATETAVSGLPNPYLDTYINSIDAVTDTGATICWSAYDIGTATVRVSTSRAYSDDIGSDVTTRVGRQGCTVITGLTADTIYHPRLETAGRYRYQFRDGRTAEFTTKTTSSTATLVITELLENFNQAIRTGNPGPNFDLVTAEDPGQSAARVNNQWVVTGAVTGCGGSDCGIYWHFRPGPSYDFTGDCTTIGCGYAQGHLLSGTWNVNTNRLGMHVKCNKDITREAGGESNFNAGTYIRNHDNSGGTSYQGSHYYHSMGFNMYNGEWMWMEFNRHPQHQVGGSGSTNWIDDPEFGGAENVHYMDGLTRWYWDTIGTQWENAVCTFDNIGFWTDTGRAPEEYVSSVNLTYSGTAYSLTWAGVKEQDITYDIRHSTSASLRTIGWNTATSDGTTTTTGTAYVVIAKSVTAARSDQVWFGIRPRMNVTAASGTPIQLTTGVGHSLVTGMAVSVASVCANANGNQTVTVVNRTQFTLDGTSGACSYGGSGGTATTTSNSQGFYEITFRDP